MIVLNTDVFILTKQTNKIKSSKNTVLKSIIWLIEKKGNEEKKIINSKLLKNPNQKLETTDKLRFPFKEALVQKLVWISGQTSTSSWCIGRL